MYFCPCGTQCSKTASSTLECGIWVAQIAVFLTTVFRFYRLFARRRYTKDNVDTCVFPLWFFPRFNRLLITHLLLSYVFRFA
jgi:hypothetical protein